MSEPTPETTTLSLPEMPVAWTEIELPPDLPMPIFTSHEPWNAKRIGALAIYCSDGRWGEAFDQFCHLRLDIPRYDRFAVPGGPAWLAQDSEKTQLQTAAHDQIEFLVKAHGLERIVLITHWGCAFYNENGQRTARKAWPDQLRDLEIAATNLRLWFPEVEVQSFLAMQLEGRISFHEIGNKPAPAPSASKIPPGIPPSPSVQPTSHLLQHATPPPHWKTENARTAPRSNPHIRPGIGQSAPVR